MTNVHNTVPSTYKENTNKKFQASLKMLRIYVDRLENGQTYL